MKVLVTGTAGFIGFHLANKLANDGYEVIGLDNINDYYTTDIKYDRLSFSGFSREEIRENLIINSKVFSNYSFIKLNIENHEALKKLFKNEKFDAVCHLAAQAGVRHSIDNPKAYIQSNIVGFMNILECCREFGVNNFSYASSSSVYGLNQRYPFSTSDSVDHPVSLYAATKRSNELFTHSYSHLFGIRSTGLRFFTVYGPWGRPDMAPFLFTQAALKNKPIDVYNHGKMLRDFTYIDDIVNGIKIIIDNPASIDSKWTAKKPKPNSSSSPFRIYNIGNSKAIKLMDFINAIEMALGVKIDINMMPIQQGDVKKTIANIDDFTNSLGYQPKTILQDGVDIFIRWYRDYYKERL